MQTRIYQVEGLSCIDCAGQIQAAVSKLESVETCQVDYATGRLTVRLNTSDFDDAPVAQIVRESGHTLRTDQSRSQDVHPALAFARFLFSRQDTALTAVAAILTLLGLTLTLLRTPVPWRVLSFGLAILVGGYPVARQALREVLTARSLGINALMVVAVTGAMAIGEWAEAAIVVVLFALGEALEGYATERARGALESLLDLAPPVALRLRADGSTEEVPVEQLSVGDRVLVRPGDRVSVDGVVRAGQSGVDQSAITGESIPVDKAPGDEVFAGTINTSGALEVEVTRMAADNTLSRMITLVQEAQSEKAPVQHFVERFARVYTPAIAVAALLIAALPPLFLGQPFWGERGWLIRALQMLVIACPCALVISTPVSVVSALTNAAWRGVLIKGGRTLESLSRIRVFAFDKTGTLTEGRPVTTDVLDVCEDTSHAHNGLQYAAAVEAQSSHPLARALVAEAQTQGIAVPPAEEVTILGGRGVTGQVGGRQVTVGSHPYFDAKLPHAETVCQEAERLAEAGKTVMLVSHDENVCSVFAVADTPRPESRDTL
ncbi:MAG: cadmium-translocating P-type ATPase, partial [Chloroflexi bacterium]